MAVRCLQLTIHSGAAAHGSAALKDGGTSVEARAWLGNMGGERGGVRREVLDGSAGLYVTRDVARVLATLDEEDLERGVCSN